MAFQIDKQYGRPSIGGQMVAVIAAVSEGPAGQRLAPFAITWCAGDVTMPSFW